MTAAPTAISADGTRLQVTVPDLATTGAVTVNGIPAATDWGFAGYGDALYRNVTVNFNAAAATAAVRFSDGGLEGLGNESWGLDNVRIVDVTNPNSPVTVYSTNFETGAGREWSVPLTDASYPGTFSRFLGRFSGGGSTLTTATTAGHSYQAVFDLYIIDSWDGNNGPDYFDVSADGTRLLHETFSNYSLAAVQSYHSGTGSVNLQIVPTLTSMSGRPGLDGYFDLVGSASMKATAR